MLVDVESLKDLERVDTGLYVATGWNWRDAFEDSEGWYRHSYAWPEFSGDADSRLKALSEFIFQENKYLIEYGLCDSPEQFKRTEVYERIASEPSGYAVAFMLHSKEDNRGMRWHKWGPYIGERTVQGYEYISDEEDIDDLYSFHIYRKKA